MARINAKGLALDITSEMGITFYNPSGAVPKPVKMAIAQISKTNVKPSTAVRILKAQFKPAITSVEE